MNAASRWVAYPYTQAEIIAMVEAAIATGDASEVERVHLLLMAANQLESDLDMHGRPTRPPTDVPTEDDGPPPPPTGSSTTPTVSVGDAVVAEGNSGPTTVTVTVTLSTASDDLVSVGWTTSDGTATAGSDYEADSGTVTFAVGETSATIVLTVLGDVTYEGDEAFSVTLGTAVGTTIGDGIGVVTITNDDATPTPTAAVGDATVVEGDSGTSTVAVTVTLSASSSETVTVSWATGDGSAAAGSDYTASSGTLTFAPGETSKDIEVTITGDTTVEADEAFVVTLTAVTGAAVADGSGVVTITNDDTAPPPPALPAVSVADLSLFEGRNGWTTIQVQVTLSASSTETVSVQLATVDGTATTSDSDYEGWSGTVTFSPGQTVATIAIRVKGDRTREPDETFTLDVLGVTGATVADGSGTITIRDDDSNVEVTAVPGRTWRRTQQLAIGEVLELLPVAIATWAEAGVDTGGLRSVRIEVADLSGRALAEARGTGTIVLDLDAAGWGWHTGLGAPPPDRIDLLSVLVHELGHLLGLDHGEHAMVAPRLAPGARPRGILAGSPAHDAAPLVSWGGDRPAGGAWVGAGPDPLDGVVAPQGVDAAPAVGTHRGGSSIAAVPEDRGREPSAPFHLLLVLLAVDWITRSRARDPRADRRSAAFDTRGTEDLVTRRG